MEARELGRTGRRTDRIDVTQFHGGMRWPHEVDRSVEVAARCRPPMDVAVLPRLTADVSRADDAAANARGVG